MSVSITLPGELERFLTTQARQMGVPVETLLVRTIVQHWDGMRRTSGLPIEETELFLRLQTLFPQEQTQEYHALCEKSDRGVITELERIALLSLIEQRDQQNAERLALIAELAQRRGVSFREMMTELGIRPD